MLMTKVQKLNQELYEDYINNRKYPTRTFLEKLTKLRREIRRCINRQVCSYCAKPVHFFKGKDTNHKYVHEYLSSALCPKCQDETLKELN